MDAQVSERVHPIGVRLNTSLLSFPRCHPERKRRILAARERERLAAACSPEPTVPPPTLLRELSSVCILKACCSRALFIIFRVLTAMWNAILKLHPIGVRLNTSLLSFPRCHPERKRRILDDDRRKGEAYERLLTSCRLPPPTLLRELIVL